MKGLPYCHSIRANVHCALAKGFAFSLLHDLEKMILSEKTMGLKVTLASFELPHLSYIVLQIASLTNIQYH